MAAQTGWFTSSHCGPSRSCTEVSLSPDGAAVRDSTDPDGPVLEFTREAWATFQAQIRRQ